MQQNSNNKPKGQMHFTFDIEIFPVYIDWGLYKNGIQI